MYRKMTIIGRLIVLQIILSYNAIVSIPLESAAESEAFATSLYELTDPLIQLDNNNVEQELLRSPDKAHLVEFYMSWCGHCRNFAPTYVKFARDVENWKNVVKIAAINCALEANNVICESNNIHDVPTLKYFPHSSTSYSNATFLQMGHQTIPEIRLALLNALLAEYKAKNHQTWPNFTYLPELSLKDVWNYVPSNQEYLALIVESESDNNTGAEFLLDLSSQKWINARRVKIQNPIVEDLGITELPSMVIMKRNAKQPIYRSEGRRSVLNEVLKFGPSGGQTFAFLLSTMPSTTALPQTTLSEEMLASKYYVSETDLLLSIWFALDNEIPFDKDDISNGNFTNLKNFINVLKTYFPQSRSVRDSLSMLNLSYSQTTYSRSDNARKLFAELYDNLDAKSENSIPANEWKKLFQSLEAKYNYPFPKTADWQHCKGSDNKYRGYTCGLWSNFHTLTVNAFLEDGFKPNYDPFVVLKAVKGYVESFFGCTECADHFMNMVTKELPMDEWVHYASDTVMYIWRAHNHVNKRLAGDNTEDPNFPKLQFPAPFLCDNCQDENGAWDSRTVLRFMLKYYTNIKIHKEQSSNVGGLASHNVFNNTLRATNV